MAVAAAVARQEGNLGFPEPPGQDLVRRRAPWGLDRDPLLVMQPLDRIEAAAPDHPDLRIRHRFPP